MNTDLNIGGKIRDLRNKNGLTQKELADRTELTKGYISQVEHGQAIPSIMTLLDILECLGTNIADFFKESSRRSDCIPKGRLFCQGRRPAAKRDSMGCPGRSKKHDGADFGNASARSRAPL